MRTHTRLALALFAILTSGTSNAIQTTEDKEPISWEANRCNTASNLLFPSFNDTAQVKYMGEYQMIDADGEHTYGYMLHLWQLEERKLGILHVYDGNIEGIPVPALFIEQEGDSLAFFAHATSRWLTETFFRFEGKTIENGISCRIRRYHCKNNILTLASDEPIVLNVSKGNFRESMKNIDAWLHHHRTYFWSRDVEGIEVGFLLRHRAKSEYERLRLLIRKVLLHNNPKAFAELVSFHCDAAGCYELGSIITQMIDKKGEQHFIPMAASLLDQHKKRLHTLIAVGLEYGDIDHNRIADRRLMEKEYKQLHEILKYYD